MMTDPEPQVQSLSPSDAPSPQRRSPGVFARVRTARGEFVRFARSVTSREQIVTFLKNLTLVIPLTILIWVYAERENDQKIPQTIPFEVVSADQGRIVDVRGMEERSVVAELTGSRSRLDYVRDLLQPRDGTSPIRITVDASLQPGREHTLNIQQLIDQDPIFKQSGVTVSNTSPSTLTVFIDKITQKEAEVRVPPGVPMIESVVFDPPKVRIDDAEQKLIQQEKDGPLFVYADLARLASLGVPGPHVEKSVKLIRSPDDRHRVIAPAEVSVSFSVREANVSYVRRTTPVFVLAPATIQAKYKVNYDPILNSVTYIGPPQKIEMLKREELQPMPRAVIEVTPKDEQASPNPTTKTVRFIDLPEGVTVDDISARREITFTMTERGTGE